LVYNYFYALDRRVRCTLEALDFVIPEIFRGKKLVCGCVEKSTLKYKKMA